MKIKKIVASGFKGSPMFSHNLTAVTVFTGENGQGKTTVLEALQLALSGSLPGLSSRPADLHALLAGGNEQDFGNPMKVAFITDDARAGERLWMTDKKGSVKYTGHFSGLPDDYSAPAVMIDPNVFLGLSGKERTKFLFRTLPPPSLEKVGPSVLTSNIKNIKLEENTEQTEQAVNALAEWVGKEWMDKPETLTVQEWLDQLVEKVRLRKNDATAVTRRMDSTVQGLTQLKQDSESLSVAERAKKDALTVLDATKDRLSVAQAAAAVSLKNFNVAKVLAQSAIDETAARASLETAQAAVNSLRDILTAPFDEQAEAAAATVLAEAERSAAKAARELALVNAEVTRLKSEIDEIVGSVCCPWCKSDREGWREKLLADKRVTLDTRCAVRTTLEYFENEGWAAVEKARSTRDEAQRVRVQRGIDEKNFNGWQLEVQRLQQILRSQADAQKAKTDLPSLEALYKSDCDEVSKAAAHRNTAQGVFESADQRHRQAIANKSMAQSQARALAEAAAAKAEAEIIKRFSEFLTELMDKVVEQSVQPVLDTCNRLCEGILEFPLCMKDGEIGMRSGRSASGFVSWKTFSGAQRLLTFAGLSLALSVGQPFKLVMIDEFGKLSAKNKIKLFGRLMDMTKSGLIDQAIIIDLDTAFYRNIGPVDGFSCIEIARAS